LIVAAALTEAVPISRHIKSLKGKSVARASSPCNLIAANGCAACVSLANVAGAAFSPTIGQNVQWEACYWNPAGAGEKQCRMRVANAVIPAGAIYRDNNLCPGAVVPPNNAALAAVTSSNMNRQRGIGPGIPISLRYDQGPGTISVILEGANHARYALTNAHVAHRRKAWNGYNNPAIPGGAVDLADEYVIQPAAMHGGQQVADIIGKVVHTKHGDWNDAGTQRGMDIALIKICTGAGAPFADCPGAIASSNAFPAVNGVGGSSITAGAPGAVADNDAVYKWGAMAGKRTGTVHQRDLAVQIPLKDVPPAHQFTNQILACGIYQSPGDSGAPLVRVDNNRIVAITSGTRDRPGGGNCDPAAPVDCCTIASPITPILAYLNAQNVDGNQPFVVI